MKSKLKAADILYKVKLWKSVELLEADQSEFKAKYALKMKN